MRRVLGHAGKAHSSSKHSLRENSGQLELISEEALRNSSDINIYRNIEIPLPIYNTVHRCLHGRRWSSLSCLEVSRLKLCRRRFKVCLALAIKARRSRSLVASPRASCSSSSVAACSSSTSADSGACAADHSCHVGLWRTH